MTEEEFERSIRALRDEGDQPAPQARLTRERILADLRPKAGKRRAIWLIPIAALLAGSTVLAATGRLPEAFHAAARALGLEARKEEPKEGTAQKSAPTKPSQPPESPPASSESVVTAAPATAESEPPPPTAQTETSSTALRSDAGTAKRAAKRRAAVAGTAPSGTAALATEVPPAHDESTASSPPPSASAPGEAIDDQGTLALYRRARKLQLDQKPAEALAAWDAYLTAEPRGPLSVDARYGRALCLVRLGRKQEARTALEPFASGKYGTYRQSEARALLDAMP
jgi:tetratricopeptide (TPR) repeat protein